MASGTYTLTEIKAPKGFGLDKAPKQFTVQSGEKAVVKVTDIAQADPVGVLLGKIDADTTSDMPQGSATLGGAEFTFKYYKGYYKTESQLKDKTPARTWVMKTDEDGYADLSEKYKVRGDDFYYNATKNPTLPLGTLVCPQRLVQT